MATRGKDEVLWDVRRVFITIKLIWHSYLVLNLDNCAHKTPTKTDLKNVICWRPKATAAVGSVGGLPRMHPA